MTSAITYTYKSTAQEAEKELNNYNYYNVYMNRATPLAKICRIALLIFTGVGFFIFSLSACPPWAPLYLKVLTPIVGASAPYIFFCDGIQSGIEYAQDKIIQPVQRRS